MGRKNKRTNKESEIFKPSKELEQLLYGNKQNNKMNYPKKTNRNESKYKRIS